MSRPLFLHFPKAGTSFSTTVRLHGGIDLYDPEHPLASHSPINVNVNPKNVVAIFREPADTMLSMYWHIRQVRGACCTVADWGWPSQATWNQLRQAIVLRGEPPSVLEPFKACMVNM